MSKRFLTRATALAASTVVIAGAGIMAMSTPASATIVAGGTVSYSPKLVVPDSLITATTSGACVTPGANRVRAVVGGPGLPAFGTAGVQVLAAPSSAAYSNSNPITLGFGSTFRAASEENGNIALQGDFEVRIQCVNSLGAVFDEYPVTLPWVDPAGNGIENAVSDVRPATTTAVTTSVTSPASAATFGGSVNTNITATVGAGTTGNVTFFDGATQLGAPVALAAGSATKSAVALPIGSHDLTAVYAGDLNNKPSTSVINTFVVNNPPATATTTTLAPIVTPVEQGTAVTFDATVVPNNTPGKFEYFDGATKLGETTNAGGTASFSTSGLGVGAHAIKAVFVPTDAAQFVTSQSAVQNITVNAPAVGFNQQLVIVEVPAGALTISVDTPDRSVLLPAVLDPSGDRYRASASMDNVKVVDTRAGSPKWDASGVLSPFVQGAGDSISAANLGWVPSVVSVSNDRQVVTQGNPVAPADGVAIGAGAGAGLSVSRTLASAIAGQSTGTAYLDATLNLVAPTTTTPSTHTAVLTFTAI